MPGRTMSPVVVHMEAPSQTPLHLHVHKSAKNAGRTDVNMRTMKKSVAEVTIAKSQPLSSLTKSTISSRRKSKQALPTPNAAQVPIAKSASSRVPSHDMKSTKAVRFNWHGRSSQLVVGAPRRHRKVVLKQGILQEEATATSSLSSSSVSSWSCSSSTDGSECGANVNNNNNDINDESRNYHKKARKPLSSVNSSYQCEIDALMAEVAGPVRRSKDGGDGGLGEAELQRRTVDALERTEEDLERSRRHLEDCQHDMDNAETEKMLLQQVFDVRASKNCNSPSARQKRDRTASSRRSLDFLPGPNHFKSPPKKSMEHIFNVSGSPEKAAEVIDTSLGRCFITVRSSTPMKKYREQEENEKQEQQHGECREELLRKLIEVEMDGQAAAKQAAALKGLTQRLREDRRNAESPDLSVLINKQKDLLLDRIADFQCSNATLRQLLRAQHAHESANLRLADQRDLLLRKLTESEEKMEQMALGIVDRERSLTKHSADADKHREESDTLANLKMNMETTCAHLRKQLHNKEGECNRLNVQLRTLGSKLAQEKIEVDHLNGLLAQARERAQQDKEALKKATRVQKERATKSEDQVEQLSNQVIKRDALLAEVRADLEASVTHLEKTTKEKTQLNDDNAALKDRMRELEDIMASLENDSRSSVESATALLHSKISEASELKLENERLKTSLMAAENTAGQSRDEMTQLQNKLRDCEAQIEQYRDKMNRSRLEADETLNLLDLQKSESRRIGHEAEAEVERVRSEMQHRLAELEPLPGRLQSTERKLADATDKLTEFEMRNTEKTKLIAELTVKLETQSDQISHLNDKLSLAREDARNTSMRHEDNNGKLRVLEQQIADLHGKVAKQEAALHESNLQLQLKNKENESLNRQLENVLANTHRFNESVRDSDSVKSLTTQSRIADIESRLTKAYAEVSRVKREKEDAERTFNSKLYDVKDQLERAQSTNRSMQNYVQFLKDSYNSVFADTMILTSSPIKSKHLNF